MTTRVLDNMPTWHIVLDTTTMIASLVEYFFFAKNTHYKQDMFNFIGLDRIKNKCCSFIGLSLKYFKFIKNLNCMPVCVYIVHLEDPCTFCMISFKIRDSVLLFHLNPNFGTDHSPSIIQLFNFIICTLDFLWGQLIKLAQVASTSELRENQQTDLLFF